MENLEQEVQASFNQKDTVHQGADLFDETYKQELIKNGDVLNSIDNEMATMVSEENDAYQAPLNAVEVQKLEESSKTLLDEITSGLKTYGKNKFWR
jgi:hypothetical protein